MTTRRPGLEMVISAHKSVAELGVIGRAEDMHQIMDAERDATLAYLDRVTRQMGGRRGQAAVATATGGLIYAHTRHATSRAGDPCPHDHVLVANLVEMADQRGGWKAADTALWREHLHAATMVGRVAAARVAVELGYGIEADPGPSGKLGHWRIAGVPDEVIEVHSKRAAEIDAECARRGETSYQARGVAARTTRQAKDGQASRRTWSAGGGASWPRWAGRSTAWPPRSTPPPSGAAPVRRLTLPAGPGDPVRDSGTRRRSGPAEGVLPARCHRGASPRTCTARTRSCLEALVDRALADPEVVPLVGVAGAREQAHSLASVLARETAIAESLSRQVDRGDAPATPSTAVVAAIGEVEAGSGRSAVGRAGVRGDGDLHVGAGSRDRGGGGRRREDHHAPGGGRRLRGLRLPGDRHRHLGPGGPKPRAGRPSWASRRRWPV